MLVKAGRVLVMDVRSLARPDDSLVEAVRYPGSLKGTVSRDFLLQVFFMNHLPPSP